MFKVFTLIVPLGFFFVPAMAAFGAYSFVNPSDVVGVPDDLKIDLCYADYNEFSEQYPMNNQDFTTESSSLSSERINNLLSTRKPWQWTDPNLLKQEADAIGVEKNILCGALMWLKNKSRSRRNASISKEKIQHYHDLNLKHNIFHRNFQVLRINYGLTRKTCFEKAQQLGVTFEELNVYRNYLLHGERIHPDNDSLLDVDVIKQFVHDHAHLYNMHS